MIKKAPVNQHYVWRRYLEAWSKGKSKGKSVWCYRQSDKALFRANPRNVGSSRYFYRVEEFSDAEIAYLRDQAERSMTDAGRVLNRELVDMFTMVSDLRRQVAEHSLDGDEAAEMEARFLEAERGMGERWHWRFEEDGLPFVERLRQQDASFLSSDGKTVFPFCFFLAAQYTRTKQMRKAVRAAMLPHGLDLERVWSVESHLWANQIGLAILRHLQRTHVDLLVNEGPVAFITGDQPVINLRDSTHPMPEFYYPVSPDTALILRVVSEGQSISARSVSQLEVENYNHTIFRWSDDQIYGQEGQYLSSLAGLPKQSVKVRTWTIKTN
ncbi:DUF4238 domain-containing protein [Rhizobium leguminosarum]|uniref:DUF4238 domain-containing protein n=1 Tax=Rhizobium leguminosarum TaxID=384 RepID=UPI001441DE68|nr:DUF4238 domain-containing protein [Rhizobium leguminosarum]MBY5869201.1 DUF4238 domain-containing protein [Rhizobium leguminosarum]NKM08334.1 DUF4238 domain-containing protein [Rhizobium leguminosarum bv. viciae]